MSPGVDLRRIAHSTPDGVGPTQRHSTNTKLLRSLATKEAAEMSKLEPPTARLGIFHASLLQPASRPSRRNPPKEGSLRSAFRIRRASRVGPSSHLRPPSASAITLCIARTSATSCLNISGNSACGPSDRACSG